MSGFHTRAYLCTECWSRVERFAYPEQPTDCFVEGEFVLNQGDCSILVRFRSKGPDVAEECDICHSALDGLGEEVNFFVEVP